MRSDFNYLLNILFSQVY